MTSRSSPRLHQSVAWALFVALIGAWAALTALTREQGWTALLPLAALFALAYAVIRGQRLSR